MKLFVRTDISPCVVHADDIGVGVPLVPGGMIDTDRIGIVDVKGFLRANGWAFTSVEDMTAEPGSRRQTRML